MRTWIKIVLAVLLVAALALVLFGLGRGLLGALNAFRGGGGEPDPMFAEQAETVTRPPEIAEGAGLSRQEADPSSGWTDEVQTPVDKTAEELSMEAEAAATEPSGAVDAAEAGSEPLP